MLRWQHDVDLNRDGFLGFFLNNIQMRNRRTICIICTPDTPPLCCPATGLDLGKSEIAFMRSFEHGFLDLSVKNVAPRA